MSSEDAWDRLVCIVDSHRIAPARIIKKDIGIIVFEVISFIFMNVPIALGIVDS